MRTLLEKIEREHCIQLMSEGKLDTSKPWTMSGSMWLSANNIHEPWIAEISPMQYARMGKAAQARYDKKRHAEWAAAGKGKEEWAKAVYDAYEAGMFEYGDKDVHPMAVDAAKMAGRRESEREQQAAFDKALKANRIQDTDELKVGDIVYSVMFRNYATIKKVSKKSVGLDYRGSVVKQAKKALEWLSYNDLEKQVKGK